MKCLQLGLNPHDIILYILTNKQLTDLGNVSSLVSQRSIV